MPTTAVLLVVCHTGVCSHRAVQFLKQAGFPEVHSLADGTAGWHQAGLPVVRGDTSQTATRVSDVVGPH